MKPTAGGGCDRRTVLAGGHVLLGKSSFWNKRQDALWCPTHSLLRGSPAHHGRWPGRRDVNLRCVLPAACPAECDVLLAADCCQ